MAIDLVTVFHCDRNRVQAVSLRDAVEVVADGRYEFTMVSNVSVNKGFAPACNEGAARGDNPIIGFLNPDLEVLGPFMKDVSAALADPDTVITGENFAKPRWEYQSWGCKEWVCGAAFFVKRDWFEKVGGFNENYKWSWEETHMIRLAESAGKVVRPISLPFRHSSPESDTPQDSAYKQLHFQRGAKYFREAWPK